MSRKKILWIVYDFVQAGGQRYVYEICKALNKEKYAIDFLKVAPMNHLKEWESEYYYQPSLALGCQVFQIDEFMPEIQMLSPDRSTLRRGINYLKRKHKIKFDSGHHQYQSSGCHNEKLQLFLSQYDHVNFSGVPVYKAIQLGMGMNIPNAIIHILSSKFQDINLYKDLEKDQFYNFVSGMKSGSIESELIDFKNYKFTHFNLCFETIPYNIEFKNETNVHKIALFTRLSIMKPLDPYFYALKILLEQGVKVELHIYGSGNPDDLNLNNQLKYLYIKDSVKFHGHVEDIPRELKENTPDLLWFQAANSQPAGYAALEVSMSGLPQVFWDFMYMGHEDSLKEIFPSFTSITSFVQFNKELLQSSSLRSTLGNKQRDFVLENYLIKDHIHTLEELFDI